MDMRKLLASLAICFCTLSAFAGAVDIRAFLVPPFTTNGGFIGLNGTIVDTNGPGLWKVISGQLVPVQPTNTLSYIFTGLGSSPFFDFEATSTNSGNLSMYVDLGPSGATADSSSIAGFFRNHMPPNAGTGIEYQSGGQIALEGQYGTGDPTWTNGATAGVVGVNVSASSRANGVIGTVDGRNSFAGNVSTNVGVFANVMRSGSGDTNVGLYAEVRTDGGGASAQLMSSVILADNRNSGIPLLTLRNNGLPVIGVSTVGQFEFMNSNRWRVFDLSHTFEYSFRWPNQLSSTAYSILEDIGTGVLEWTNSPILNLIQSTNFSTTNLVGFISPTNIGLNFAGQDFTGAVLEFKQAGGKGTIRWDYDASFLTNMTFAVATKTANFTLSQSMSDLDINNNGAGGTVTNTLPSAANIGVYFNFTVMTAQNVTIKATGSDTIRYGGTVSGAGGIIFSSTVGNSLRIRCFGTTQWYVDNVVGTWTIQ